MIKYSLKNIQIKKKKFEKILEIKNESRAFG